ncbi:MAG: outer membrane protein assembly factor [Paludibacteraceae bacterium]|nr:outer membrane protein assembly factor [Paludibacteraceae bacterium]
MKRFILIVVCSLLLVPCSFAKKEKKPQEVDSLGNPIKTGWNFGILPSVAYDADYGFQGGILTNVYYYGDGKQYPEYIHSIYFEGAYTTKHHGIFRLNYDSKYLIPRHRLTLDATYLPDAMCDFYGFNGFRSVFNNEWSFWKKDPAKMPQYEDYQSRVFYKYKRDLIRFAADIEGTIYKDFKWNAGLGVLGYIIDDCDIDMLNGKNEFDPALSRYEQKALNPNIQGLYDLYKDWGLISPDEQNGGWHPYARAGVTFDTRDKRQGPNRGIYLDAFFTYSAAFNAKYGQQAAAGYNHLQFNFTFRHYVPCYIDAKGRNRITFAYRIGTQNLIAGKSPFYMDNYLNTLFIQRVYYEGLGGGNSIRGMMANRLSAKGFAFANVEFRFRVVNFDIGHQHFYIGLNPFFDLGVVTQPYTMDEDDLRTKVAATTNIDGKPYEYNQFFSSDEKDIYRPHMTAGVGLKVGMNENFVLSADWAMPVNEKYYMQQDNSKLANFYVKMGYLF